jgi:holliday junction DNA helicase RuvA
MIEYIRGIVDELTPTQAVIEANGVGYSLLITLNTYTAIQGKGEVRLFVYESIREDAYQLYGFHTRQEREIFVLLLGVSGVGGQTARMVLSAFTPADMAGIVQSEDVRALKSVKGIGPKAAQRIIVDLSDKMNVLLTNASGDGAEGTGVHTPAERETVEEAVQALSVLGFPPAAAQKAVVEILKEQPGAAVELLIKEALKRM